MRNSVTLKKLAFMAAAAVGFGASAAMAATLELQLVAPNYDPTTGIWTDTSGSGNNATQATEAARPALAANATPTGQSAVRFDGNDDGFVLPSFLTGDAAAEVFVVIKADVDAPTGSGQTGLWNFGAAGDNSHYPWTDGVIYDEFGATGRKATGDRATPLNQYNVYNVRSEPGLWESRLNNAEVFTTTDNTVGFATNLKLGESEDPQYNFDGDIAEIRIYTYDTTAGTALSESERSAVFTELTNAYIVPEPASIGLLGLGGFALLARRRR